jgi:hypothetical protein
MGEVFEAIGDHWHDDTFDRKAYAAYLTMYLRGKVLGAGSITVVRPFTMALDAKWGSGKTFFIQRWSKDLRTPSHEIPGHTVVTFDAWAADYATDPLVAFMSELRSELEKAVNTGGLAIGAKTKATHAIKAATKNVRQVALPVGGAIAKGLVKKISGIELTDIAEALGGRNASSTADTLKVEDVVSTQQANAALDRLFSIQMSEHAKRKRSIDDFKTELGTVLEVLGTRAGYSAPLFIVIDELDRCKPSFAVGLLEAVKHVFGVPGVCVVIATNMEQLAHTVKAVYGEGFDGRTYLHRFFDAIYALPSASGPKLLDAMLKERPILQTEQRCKWAIPSYGFKDDQYGPGKAGMLAWIFAGLGLDLRSQRQVLELMEATALGIPEARRIHGCWLALVCGLWHSKREAFHELEEATKAGSTGNEVWKALGFGGMRRTYFSAYAPPNSSKGHTVSLSDIGSAYCSKAKENLTELDAPRARDSQDFSSLVVRELTLDTPHTYNPTTHYSTGLFEYFALVRTAGHFQPDM